ncbi:MAG: DUF4245 domain-containing protein [Rhodoglobus sp.]
MAGKQPAVVAELGRPETTEETAARKAENSRKRRTNQTALNLVAATIASLGIVLFLVVVVVRPTPEPTPGVDYATIATQSQPDAAAPLIVPTLPDTWSANAAKFSERNAVPTWYVGFITPSVQFIALNQGIGANPTWQSVILDNAIQTGTVTIDGIDWTIYDQRDQADSGNFAYSMAATVAQSTVLLHGTAPVGEFELLAASIASEVTTP